MPQPLLLKRTSAFTASAVTTDLTWLSAATIDLNASASATVSSATLGAADSNRYIVVNVSGITTSGQMPTAITVGGISATKRAEATQGGTAPYASLWVAAVPTGTTGDIVVTYAGTNLYGRVGWARLIHEDGVPLATAANSSVSTSSLDLSLNTATDGVTSGCAADVNGAAITWNGATSRDSTDVNTNEWTSTTTDDIATGETPRTVDASSSGQTKPVAGVMVSWD